MSDEQENEPSDSDWIRLQRLEEDRRRWLWGLLRTLATWIAGALAGLWASVDAGTKIIEWWTRK